MTATLILIINEQIRFGLSPEQVSGWLKEDQGILISHERIYQHIWEGKRKGGNLHTHLRQAHKKRRKKYGAEVRFQIELALNNALILLKKSHASAIGRLIQL